MDFATRIVRRLSEKPANDFLDFVRVVRSRVNRTQHPVKVRSIAPLVVKAVQVDDCSSRQ